MSNWAVYHCIDIDNNQPTSPSRTINTKAGKVEILFGKPDDIYRREFDNEDIKHIRKKWFITGSSSPIVKQLQVQHDYVPDKATFISAIRKNKALIHSMPRKWREDKKVCLTCVGISSMLFCYFHDSLIHDFEFQLEAISVNRKVLKRILKWYGYGKEFERHVEWRLYGKKYKCILLRSKMSLDIHLKFRK